MLPTSIFIYDVSIIDALGLLSCHFLSSKGQFGFKELTYQNFLKNDKDIYQLVSTRLINTHNFIFNYI